VTTALEGIRVVDLATERAELTGRMLADLGALVIKVEPPGGAASRRLPPFDGDTSLCWSAYARGKRSVVLDLASGADRARLADLVANADVLVESFDPGVMAGLGLGYATLRERNPGLVYASVTPYGQDGPDAATPATDLTLEAAGGLVSLQGDRDRPPIPLGFPQASLHAGAQAAADVVIALCERERSGLGQHLDVSIQAAVVWTLMNATGYPPNTGGNPPGTCELRAGPPAEILPGLALPLAFQCADGSGVMNFGLPNIGWKTLHRMMKWAESRGGIPEPLRGIDWRTWVGDAVEQKLSVERVRDAIGALLDFLRTRTKHEVRAFSLENEIVLAPVHTVADLRVDPQLAAREYWTQLGGRTHAGPFARLSGTPIRYERPAPALGEAQPLLDALRPRAHAALRPTASAFDGLRVADFAWVGVGPLISKAFADHGATVVKVESANRPDVLRQLPPFKDGKPGYDRSQFLANFNTSKLSLSLDLSTDGGRALARRLALWADVVTDSFTPGTMQKLGLDYASIARERPDIVMLSTCLRGQTGPERAFSGFGNQGAALAGLYSITGWPDRPPCGPWGAYTDFIAPRFGVTALAAALYHRARTGEGQHIDLSQVEAGIHFLEPLVLDYEASGRVAGPIGHASPRASPHGVFACAGTERYLALAVETAAQWEALAGVVAPLAAFSFAARRAESDAIAELLRAWCRDRDPFAAARELQAAGVPAAAVQHPSDLYGDRQLAHRGFFVTLDHPEMGPTPYDGPVTRFSRTPARLRLPAPLLGQHTYEVLSGLLGLSDDEIAEHAASGALS
jgi:crotonobetainyl-CoA:carnitine CoA-transferase CaiB-like acyl-CoA transferase